MLEAVIVCVDYSDFLDMALVQNKRFFDHVVIVTDSKDSKTKEVCEKHGVTCVVTDCFYDDGAVFNKGKAINVGFGNLKHYDWVVHMDADIVMNDSWGPWMIKRCDPKCIYGIHRIDVIGRDKYDSMLVDGVAPVIIEGTWPVQDYCPLGYFQLFHWSYCRMYFVGYPQGSGDASTSDIDFARKWTKDDRIRFNNVTVFHLMSEESEQGKNWKGRKSKLFI